MTKANEPAFPASEGQFNKSESGLTKREYLAGQAMKGVLSNPNTRLLADEKMVSERALFFADDLIAQLEKTEK